MSESILCSLKKSFWRQNTKFNDYVHSQRVSMKLTFIVYCGSEQV